MRAGAFILTLLMALLSFEASGSGAVPVRDAHGEIAVITSPNAPACPDHGALRHQCCLAVCGSLIASSANNLTLQILPSEKLTGSSAPGRATATAERVYRPPKRL